MGVALYRQTITSVATWAASSGTNSWTNRSQFGGFLTILDDETSLFFNLLRHSTRSTASWFILFFPLQALNCYCRVELRFFFCRQTVTLKKKIKRQLKIRVNTPLTKLSHGHSSWLLLLALSHRLSTGFQSYTWGQDVMSCVDIFLIVTEMSSSVSA